MDERNDGEKTRVISANASSFSDTISLELEQKRAVGFNGPFFASAVNDTFVQSPKSFDFNGFNPFGDDPQQSPIWIRPVALKMANYNMLHKDLIQVFGHTVSRDPQETFERSLCDPLGHYFHADMLEKRCYLKFNGNDFQLAQFVK